MISMLWLSHAYGGNASEISEKVDEIATKIELKVLTLKGCGHCAHFKQELISLQSTLPQLHIDIYEVVPGSSRLEHLQAGYLAEQNKVHGFPTSLVQVNGKTVKVLEGYMPSDKVVEAIQSIQGSSVVKHS